MAYQTVCMIAPHSNCADTHVGNEANRAQPGGIAYPGLKRAETNLPDISVLVSVWNDGVWLRDFIDAVLAQTDCNFELLIVNDASDDMTADILAQINDPRIRIFSNTTRRYWANAMNDLAQQSRGRLLKLVCADDLLQVDCLSQFYAFFQRHPEIGYIVSGYEMIDNQGHVTQPLQSKPLPPIIASSEADKLFMKMGCWFGTSMMCIPKLCWDEIGGLRDVTAYNPKQIPIAEDFDMAVRLNAKRAAGYIDAPLIKIRAHATRTCSNKAIPSLKVEANLRILKHIAERIDQTSPSASITATTMLFQQGAGNLNMGLQYIRTGQITTGLNIILAVLSVLSPYQIAKAWTARMINRIGDRSRHGPQATP
ncbi:MAG: hypothetical protein CTY31_02255 [Hyphomicrobium sp.]|nr:MAG: hypothetical protein CTY39_01040 [Hyphomicrobium sp.]PPD01598.1 MAG: hypothetical protein CTY31_02255 [Hyphomicrobium sp.]